MAILDEPDIKPLADEVRKVVNPADVPEELARPTRDFTVDDIITQATFAILDFPDWYFNTDSSRNRWVPTDPPVYDNDLVPVVKQYVEETLEELRDDNNSDELPYEPDVDKLVNKLVGLVVEWKKWYPTLRKERDTANWYLNKGANDEIYVLVNDYGDEDKSPGMGNVYDDDDLPWDDTDIDDDMQNPDILFYS